MIELVDIEFGAIRSFVDRQYIPFKDRSKLIQIDGKNENTGGSSGAGKSTVLIVLDYILGLNEIPSTVLQSRLTKEGMWAIGRFIIDGQNVEISRSKKDGLVVKVDELVISGNVKLAEEKIDQLIGIPKKIFKKMIHKKQKEGGFFLNMTPKEMYEFLVSILGLEKYITDLDIISASITTYEGQISNMKRDLELNKASVMDFERILSDKKTPTCTVTDSELQKLNDSILFLRANINDLKIETKTKIEQIPKAAEVLADTHALNEKIAALVPARVEITNKIKTLDGFKTTTEAELNKIPYIVANAKKLGEEISKIAAEKKCIQDSQCPRCLQKWVGDSATQSIVQIDLKTKELIEKAMGLKTQIDQKTILEEKLQQLISGKTILETQLKENADQRAALDAEKYSLMEVASTQNTTLRNEYTAKVAEIDSKNRAIIDAQNEELKKLEIDLSSKDSQKNSYLQSLHQYEKEAAALKSAIEEKVRYSGVLSVDLSSLMRQTVVAQESKRALKAFVLQTLQETLDSIGESATDIIGLIPNMATSTIYFESCKETKSGSIKDEIVAIINSDGENDVPIKSLSGGERTSIDLAVDLAVIDVIETKASKGANFIFMDEPFDGLDAVCKENCLEILKQIDTNKKIIMVDHSSELKEMVSDVILVVKKGEQSTLATEFVV